MPVVVIGAGPTGLTAATLLARHGIPTLVLERHRAPYPLPRAVHLDDEVHRILQALGVHEAFSAISRPARGMRLLDGSHRVLGEFLRDSLCGQHGFPQANMFDQPELEGLLRDNLKNHPLVTLRGGIEVTGVSRTLLADAILGCDGANSLVRASIGSRMQDLATAQQWLIVDIRCRLPPPAWDGVHQVCDPQRPATYMRVGGDRYRWEFRLRPGEPPEELTDRRRLLRLIAPWTTGIPEDELQVVRTAAYTFRAQVADRWRHGRIFLLGDAAHLTPPFIGQGMGSGLRDAYNLAWKLARVLTGRAAEALLDSYQAERHPHARQLIRKAVAIGALMTGGGPGAALARRAALPAVSRLLDDLLGERFALLANTPLSPALHRLVRVLDARVIHLRDPQRPQLDTGHSDIRADPSETALVHWMGTASAVLLRPDRVVLATARPGPDPAGRACGDDLATAAAAWAPLLSHHGISLRDAPCGKTPHPG